LYTAREFVSTGFGRLARRLSVYRERRREQSLGGAIYIEKRKSNTPRSAFSLYIEGEPRTGIYIYTAYKEREKEKGSRGSRFIIQGVSKWLLIKKGQNERINSKPNSSSNPATALQD